jgi:hypothetical protein
MSNKYEEKNGRTHIYYEQKDNLLIFNVASNYSRSKKENTKFTTKTVQRFLESKGYSMNELKNVLKEDYVCNFNDIEKELSGEWIFQLPKDNK